MISILIPIYNFDVCQLVADLKGQCEKLAIKYEIICFDDGSGEDYKTINRRVKSEHIQYQELPKNLGRSAIRNALGKAAKFPYLLFMDCDSKVVRADYMEKYIRETDPATLLYGGRCYASQMPEDESLRFHWYYGMKREVSPVSQRGKMPYHGFMTNNFLIPKDVFLRIQFDESLRQYGHEDTLFGLELKNRNIRIRHIDNPLEHLGLEPARTFLRKTRKGIENLLALYQEGKQIDTKLLRVFEKCPKMGWGMDFS